MYFSIEHDQPDELLGYFAPDAFAEIPKIDISVKGYPTVTMECNEILESTVKQGLHETGRVRFRLDDEIVPELATNYTLTLREHRTGMLIYRRFRIDRHIPTKILRVETRLVPDRRLDVALRERFQYWESGIEAYGHSAMVQMFYMNGVESVYLSGKLFMQNFDTIFERGFRPTITLTDPFYELAERLFLFSRISKGGNFGLAERDRLYWAGAIEHFDGVDVANGKALANAIKSAPKRVLKALESPYSQQLVARSPGENVDRRSVSAALDMLSRFEVIGLRDKPGEFTSKIAQMAQVDASKLPASPKHKALEAIADRLREIRSMETVLENDLILLHFVRQAFAKADKTQPAQTTADAPDTETVITPEAASAEQDRAVH